MSGGIAALTGCLGDITGTTDWADGRIRARPGTPTITPPTGVTTIPPSVGIDGLIFVPTTYKRENPAPVALLLHGAGRTAAELMTPISALAESRGLVLVALTATNGTWDAIQSVFGNDVRNINTALEWLFARCSVDTTRLGVIGFSDGATYAIGLGRANGDLFRRVNVYSPGFILSITPVGKPEFFITHGTQDQVLSFNTTRDEIVPSLRNAGYSVEFRQWEGGHGVSSALLEESVDWFVRK